MKKLYLSFALASGAICLPLVAHAQLSQNPDKFLGNITTQYRVDTDGFVFADYWNQITPENESKWASIEGSNNSFNWTGCDACVNYAKEHNFPFKFHTLVWGSQYPSWMDNLTPTVQYNEIVNWMDAVKERYPDLDLIDVVNEAIPGHAPAPYKNALGGDGYTGYDWIIKAFDMAHERWPNAILIYNDYNTFQWNTDQFISLVQTIRDAGAPIDAYGCQSHDLTDCSFTTFKNSMTKIQNALKMPMYSSEYDIGTEDDAKQKKQYSDQIKYMWECDYVAGITLWGWIYGKTWTSNGNSGIIKNGEDRPAMTWLREYMASDEAKNAKSPFPGMKKEASVYVRPATPFPGDGVPFDINVEAYMRTKTIDKVELYINNQLVETFTEEPYVYTYTPSGKGKRILKAVVYDTEGNTYERTASFKVMGERLPFNGEPITIPGRVQAEDFDICGEGVSFHDSDSNNSGTNAYRTDGEGVDIVVGGTGYAIGHTNAGEWLEYTVEVTRPGRYEYWANASSGMDGAAFTMTLRKDDIIDEIASVEVPNTGDWNSYTEVNGRLNKRLSAGTYTLRIAFTGGYTNLDYVHLGIIGGIDDIKEVESGTYDVFTTTGMYAGEITIDSASDINSKINAIIPQRGIYLIRNKATGESQMVQTR